MRNSNSFGKVFIFRFLYFLFLDFLRNSVFKVALPIEDDATG